MIDAARKGSATAPVEESRRARKKAQTRSQIFEAGLRLFEAEGFEEVTVARICAAADVARATFFLHFPSKSALLIELNALLGSDLAGQLASSRGRAASEYRLVVDLLSQRWSHQPGVLARLLHELLAPRPALAPGEHAGQDLRGVVEEIIRRGQERGELRRNVSARLAATMFLTTTAALLSGGVYAEGEATPEEMRNQLLHALLHGMIEPKPRLKWRRPDAGTNRGEKP